MRRDSTCRAQVAQYSTRLGQAEAAFRQEGNLAEWIERQEGGTEVLSCAQAQASLGELDRGATAEQQAGARGLREAVYVERQRRFHAEERL